MHSTPRPELCYTSSRKFSRVYHAASPLHLRNHRFCCNRLRALGYSDTRAEKYASVRLLNSSVALLTQVAHSRTIQPIGGLTAFLKRDCSAVDPSAEAGLETPAFGAISCSRIALQGVFSVIALENGKPANGKMLRH